MSISVGQKAPDFTLQNQGKKDVKLSDFAGKKNVVLVWYPLDWSPTCTNEHACFVNDMKSFETLDAEVLGVSVDSVWSHKAYADKMGIKYSLLADFHPKGAASEKYGVYLADKGITGRAIAIVNKAGNVAWFKNYDIPVVPDLKEVAAALGQVTSIRQSYERKIAEAPQPDKQRVTDEANSALQKAVTDQGLSVDEYNTILQTAQNDPTIRQKLAQRIPPAAH